MLKITNPDYEEMSKCFKFLVEYFWNEMSWEYFRSEMLNGTKEYSNARKANAQQIALMLASIEEEYPSLKKLIQGAK